MSTNGDDNGSGGGGAPETVPLVKYNKAQEEIRKLNDQLAAARAEGETKAGEWRSKYEKARETHAADVARLGEDVGLASLGLDEVGRDVLRLIHGKIPAEGRAPLADYARGLAAEGADVPAPLRPYFAKQAAGAQSGASGQGQAAGAPPPKVAASDPAPKPPGNGVLAALKAAEETFRLSRTPENAKALAAAADAAMDAGRKQGVRS